MLEVTADADALRVDVERGLGGPGLLIVERDLCVDPVADGLHAIPALVAAVRMLRMVVYCDIN